MKIRKLVVMVLSGLAYAGKSHYQRLLEQCEVFRDFQIVSADFWRSKIIGDRLATAAEWRVFREGVWFDIKRNLVIERKPVLLEMVLKTQSDHFRPLTAAIDDARWHLIGVASERQHNHLEAVSYDVQLKVVTLFTDPQALERRIGQRRAEIEAKGNISGTNVFDLKSFVEKSGIDVFELPHPSQSLLIDASDESADAVARNVQEISDYVVLDALHDSLEVAHRFRRAQAYLSELKTLARR